VDVTSQHFVDPQQNVKNVDPQNVLTPQKFLIHKNFDPHENLVTKKVFEKCPDKFSRHFRQNKFGPIGLSQIRSVVAEIFYFQYFEVVFQ
jgi:hypothetical protein